MTDLSLARAPTLAPSAKMKENLRALAADPKLEL
jgi:hypothetical protein